MVKRRVRVSGIPFKDRGKRANEYIQTKIGPKPLQEPHIPIYLGSYSQRTFARIANYANGWICVIRDSLEPVKSNIDKIRKEWYKVKREPENIHIAVDENLIDTY